MSTAANALGTTVLAELLRSCTRTSGVPSLRLARPWPAHRRFSDGERLLEVIGGEVQQPQDSSGLVFMPYAPCILHGAPTLP